jgi:hypothetical protein
LYRVTVAGTDVSENISLPSSGSLKVIGFHSCITVESLLIILSIEGHYLGSKAEIHIMNPDETFL